MAVPVTGHHQRLQSQLALLLLLLDRLDHLPAHLGCLVESRGKEFCRQHIAPTMQPPCSPAVSENRRWYRSKLPKLTHSDHPRAATQNSISSGRCTLSDSAAEIAEANNVFDLNKYSATPDVSRCHPI